jgi:hypothetical protein
MQIPIHHNFHQEERGNLEIGNKEGRNLEKKKG